VAKILGSEDKAPFLFKNLASLKFLYEWFKNAEYK
jgi:hypothetical protein